MADREVYDEEQALKDMSAGFEPEADGQKPPVSGDDAAPVSVPEATPEAKTDKTPPKAKVETKEDAPETEYVRITQKEFDEMRAATARMVTADKLKDTIGGIMGDLESRIVRKLQAQTPEGKPVEIPKAVLAKVRQDYPDLADLLEADLAEAFKGLRGTGAEAPTQDAEAIRNIVVAGMRRQAEEALDDAHPSWREIVGAVDENGNADPENEFRKWLSAQDAGYQAKINGTDNAAVIARAIDNFLAFKEQKKVVTKLPTPKIVARTNVIKSSVQPKGDGGQPPPGKSAEDEFAEGFKTG